MSSPRRKEWLFDRFMLEQILLSRYDDFSNNERLLLFIDAMIRRNVREFADRIEDEVMEDAEMNAHNFIKLMDAALKDYE